MTAVTPAGVTEADLMPALFHAADQGSKHAQNRHFRWLKGIGITGVAAAAAGVAQLPVGPVDLLALAATLFFGAQLAMVLGAGLSHDDAAWYDARAAAESMKTMSWRFGVGGEPFPLSVGDDAARANLVERARRILTELSETLAPAVEVTPGTLPVALVDLRHSPLAVRQEVYRRLRLGDQFHWYRRKSSIHKLAQAIRSPARAGSVAVIALTCDPDTSVRDALGVMFTRDYSQLPFQRQRHGWLLVTRDQVARWLTAEAGEGATVTVDLRPTVSALADDTRVGAVRPALLLGSATVDEAVAALEYATRFPDDAAGGYPATLITPSRNRPPRILTADDLPRLYDLLGR